MSGPFAALDIYRPPSGVARAKVLIRRVRRNRFALGALVLLAVLVVMTVIAPVVTPFDPTAQLLSGRLRPPLSEIRGEMHLFGTDQLGRDLFSRVLVAGRASLLIAVIVVLVAGTIGTVLGLIAGYYGGWVDSAIMRAVDLAVAFPGLLLTLAILAVIGPSVTNVIVVLVLTGWMVYARNIRARVLSLRRQVFIDAAIANGCEPVRVIRRHILPNVMNPLVPLAMLEMARVILVEAILSFLGMGIQPPQVSWGLLVSEGREYVTSAWWLPAFPGLAIMLTTLLVNAVASQLQTSSSDGGRGA
jgi:peptide/nickel transport system permease protein